MSKRKFLVVYDYETGGVWAWVNARSAEEILSKYPDLEVVENRPKWMQGADYEAALAANSFDIDDPPPRWAKRI